jgi:hypothetical protein
MNDYINKLLRQAFNVDKYGVSPFSRTSNTIIEVEKEEVPQKMGKKSKKTEEKTVNNVVEDNTINEDGIKVVKTVDCAFTFINTITQMEETFLINGALIQNNKQTNEVLIYN